MLMCVPEIPGFLSVEESSVVMQLAQLKGLTHSALHTAPDSQEEQLTQDELFSLLDLNQDGLLQREEVSRSLLHLLLLLNLKCISSFCHHLLTPISLLQLFL